MLPRLTLALGAAGLLACAGSSPAPAPVPAREPAGGAAPPVVARPDAGGPAPMGVAPVSPIAPPDVAFRRGWMPLRETGADTFRRAHPTFDGRGVVIGILDSGIDGGVDGLDSTSTGEAKLLDLRDFSGEGRIALEPARVAGDTLVIGGRRLLGAAALAQSGTTVYAGALAERPLGKLPASDVNGDGDDLDSLVVVVARDGSGWALLADTDGNGSLAGERPVRDYLVARETFGWHQAGRPAPLTLAVNLADSAGVPRLDLFFDTSGHGTHVAGIAAAHDMYGVAGFDGVAPGASLLGLKISDDAHGGISTTGSMIRAIDYAIRFAAERRLPLVLNMSFGVGNERDGAAVIDRMIDSVLAEHPEVVFTISAGNDGPGLSSLGFPGSALRSIGVGATYPDAFLPPSAGAPRPDAVAFFSSRGGQLAKPDIVTPGIAYSTVPRWNTGDEQKGGTSMAAPHAAGLAALLVSALHQTDRPIDAGVVKRALMASARALPNDGFLDEGMGLPDAGRAWSWLERGIVPPDVTIRIPGDSGATAAFRPAGLAGPADTIQVFELVRPAEATPVAVRLSGGAPWLVAPATVTLRGGTSRVTVRYRASALREPGLYSAVVSGWTADTLAGPVFKLVNTVVVPYPSGASASAPPATLPASGVRRFFFRADSARPFVVEAATASPGQGATLHLHEPGGMPYRDENGVDAGSGEQAAGIAVDARDVVAGVYEAVAVAPPVQGTTVGLQLRQSPFTLAARRTGVGSSDGVRAELRNVSDSSARGQAAMLLVGGERTLSVSSRGSATRHVAFTAPAWARYLVVDVSMDPGLWPRFTDFGVTLFDSAGRQVDESPLNYAIGRLRTMLPATSAARPLDLVLMPGFAAPGEDQPWAVRISIRLYADSAQLLQPATGQAPLPVEAAAGATATLDFGAPVSPWPLGDGFVPLGVLLARVGEDTWTREVGLSPSSPSPSVTR